MWTNFLIIGLRNLNGSRNAGDDAHDNFEQNVKKRAKRYHLGELKPSDIRPLITSYVKGSISLKNRHFLSKKGLIN